jgi:1,4-alpha-glucan branching enzyme
MDATSRKDCSMFTQGQAEGTITFCFTASSGTQEVSVAGTFSQWNPVAMKKLRGGSFAVTIPIPPGRHEYRFIVDGRWTTDSDNANHVANPYGTFNSIVQVAQSGSRTAGSAEPSPTLPSAKQTGAATQRQWRT